MSKFLVTYFGGGRPATPEQAEQVKAAFGQWLDKAGKAVVDPGAPLQTATQVANGHPHPRVEIGGYSVIEAPSLDEAVAILKSHPFVARGGTLQVDEAVSI
ncbi:MAG TPA: YciI family protein [Candidatus Dormibacteraeota bacterium]|nr:YciI family protein [Candidatus Dormibacteraeota bacterium]